MQNVTLGRPSVLFAMLAAATLAPIGGAYAAGLEPETVLYSFCAKGGKTCTDSAEPVAALVSNAAGRLYGTTQAGGAHSKGTVFELTPNAAKTKWAANAAKTKWTETVLYSFCAQNCTDGFHPLAGLIMDRTGRLYGTTDASGGKNRFGTVFELAPNMAKTKWTETVLYSFGAHPSDGSFPNGLTIDAKGALYGTASSGGSHDEAGVVFEVSPNAAKTKWTETILYDFCARSAGGEPCVDGYQTNSGLVMDAAGHLYGTTIEGGAYPGTNGKGGGTVFELP